ncbi:MAG: hypothetical protein JO187_13675 [Acidobacteria bacterium]|nr:hypothetical protein [Acidobacteriota bacterium]
MPVLDAGVRTLTNRLPKVISPKAHAIIDYASAGTFITAGILMMGSRKRAGIGSIICGAAQAGLVMMTDMPGGVFNVIDLDTHLKVDAGFSGFVATLPSLLGFSDDKKSWFFRAQGMNIAAVGAMTEYEQGDRYRARNMRKKRAA